MSWVPDKTFIYEPRQQKWIELQGQTFYKVEASEDSCK
jgi:hypothetical protein